MILKFVLVCLVVFAFLTFLKFVEDSPVRSWKTVFFTGIPLAFITCYYVNCAFPGPPPSQPRSERVNINRAELERTIRRIEGVDRASINGMAIEMNFREPKPITELKQVGQHIAGAAAYFLQNGKTNRITIRMTVRGQDRYELEYDAKRGVINEQEF